MKSVLFTAMDGGGYGSIAPLEGMVKEAGYETQWVVGKEGVAIQKLQKAKREFLNFEGFMLEGFIGKNFANVGAVVAGVSSKPGPDFWIAKEAMSREIPVVKVLDFWGTGQPHEKGFAPTRLCVLDKPSIEYESKMRVMGTADIRVTGDPKIDALMKVDTKAYSKNRQTLGIADNEIFIVFIGSGSQSRSDEIFYPFVDALVELDSEIPANVVLGVLLHPKSNPENYAEKYYEYLNKQGLFFKKDEGVRLLGDTSNIIVVSDLIVGATSTELISSCYLRRPTLSIIFSDGANFEEFFEPRGFSELTLPSVECGAALLATNKDQIKEQLDDLFWDWPDSLDLQSDLLVAQEKHYNLDGKNTERAFSVLKECLD